MFINYLNFSLVILQAPRILFHYKILFYDNTCFCPHVEWTFRIYNTVLIRAPYRDFVHYEIRRWSFSSNSNSLVVKTRLIVYFRGIIYVFLHEYDHLRIILRALLKTQ